MASSATTDLPSSAPVFDILNGFLNTQLLSVGVDLGIFDVLAGRQKLSADQIADKLNLKADLLVRYLRALVGVNLLELHDGTAFSNTPASDVYLVSSSPRSVIGAIRFMKEVEGEAYRYLPDAIRGDYSRLRAAHARHHGHDHGHGEHGHGIEHTATHGHGGEGHQHADAGKPHGEGEETKNFGDVLKKDPGMAQVFSEGMMALGRADMDCLRFVDFTGVHKAVDLGGSLGQQARELRRLHPSVETVVVADLEQVVKIGSSMKENKDANIEYQTVNFVTDELPKADAYILGHVLHGNEKNITDLLKKVHGALNDGGLLVVLEGVLHEDRVGPTRALLLDMIMLARDAGRERTPGDYKSLLGSYGFRDVTVQFVDGAQNFDVITARKA